VEDALRTLPLQDPNVDLRQRLPEWKAYCVAHPDAAVLLAQEPDFLVLRAVGRVAAPPMDATQESVLAVFLDDHPELERTFSLQPDQARAPAFFATHPDYARFLDTHAALAVRLGRNPATH